jgi:gas vesicle protein
MINARVTGVMGRSSVSRISISQIIAGLMMAGLLGATAPVLAAEPAAKDINATAKAMADELKAMGLAMTPEKQRAIDAMLKKYMTGMAPEMNAMGKNVAQSMDTPEMRASMDKVAKDMSGVMAKQVPVMMQAMQPMLKDMLPQLLRMQADMLQIMFTPPAAESKSKDH